MGHLSSRLGAHFVPGTLIEIAGTERKEKAGIISVHVSLCIP